MVQPVRKPLGPHPGRAAHHSRHTASPDQNVDQGSGGPANHTSRAKETHEQGWQPWNNGESQAETGGKKGIRPHLKRAHSTSRGEHKPRPTLHNKRTKATDGRADRHRNKGDDCSRYARTIKDLNNEEKEHQEGNTGKDIQGR